MTFWVNLVEVSQKSFFKCFQEKNHIPGKGMNRVTDNQN